MRAFKDRIARLLESDPFQESLSQILRMPARRAISPLLSLLYSTRERIRWRAVTALGAVVAVQSETDIERARTVMRRLMWNLNDESGGIGWGSAEAMGEICARSERLSREFSKILISYIDPKCNFIENEALQQGILWGIGRIARVRAAHLQDVAALLIPFLSSNDSVLRGLAVWAASFVKDSCLETHLSALTKDQASITLFINGEPTMVRIRDLAFSGLTGKTEEREV